MKILKTFTLFVFLLLISFESHTQALYGEAILFPDGISVDPEQYFIRPEFHDLENDGDKDIFLTCLDTAFFSFETPSIFKNEGTSDSAAYDSITLSPVFNGFSAALINQATYGDINNDGTLDILQNIAYEDDDDIGRAFLFFPNERIDSLDTGLGTVNPFGLNNYSSGAYVSFCELRDFDQDGDLDLMLSEFSGRGTAGTDFTLRYIQNTGSPDEPQFAPPTEIAFDTTNLGLLLIPTFGDFDEDGDPDMLALSAGIDGQIGTYIYYENIPENGIPVFTNAMVQPFNLDTTYIVELTTPSLTDYDNDGDLDLFVTSTRDLFEDPRVPKVRLYLNQQVNKTLRTFTQIGLEVYPNPAEDHLWIQFEEAITGHLIIYDQTGRLVLHRFVEGTTQSQLDVSQLLPGAYILYYEDQKQKGSQQLIIK